MFTDEIEIILKAGNGGSGKVSFFPGEKSGPDGGSGGDGGNLYVRADEQHTNLNQLLGKKVLFAENGKSGGSNKRTGLDGGDLEIKLPVGTLLLDQENKVSFELVSPNQKILICKGGRGGRGNFELRSSRNTTPMTAEKGWEGEKKHLKIIVRLIADFGLIGLPNAGKSSLLNELTNAGVKVADYPFTTLEPNLGVFRGKVIADIPGLIEGAHRGKGLGIKFLKHIEKVSLLLHCISSETEDVLDAYEKIMEELKAYNPQIVKKRQIILLTKADLTDSKELDKKEKKLKKMQKDIFAISIYDWESLDELKENLIRLAY